MQYTHAPLGQEVRSVSGYYVVETEKRVPFEGDEVLVVTGHMVIDTSCCGVGGCGFALVPGFVRNWQHSRNEKGELLTEVEPVRDEEQKETLRKLILSSENVQQVNFL